MNMKNIISLTLGALVAALIGYFFVGSGRPTEGLSPQPSESPGQRKMIASLREDNERLRADLAGLGVDLAKLTETNAALMAQRAALPPPPSATGGATLGWMPRYERQRMVMNSLRQIAAAREQFVLEKGQAPGSVHELVGLDSFIKTVRPVSGEDYSGLPMAPGQPLSVTTADGMTVTYDPSGATTTRIEMPPVVARAEELNQKVGPAIQKAFEAYRLAHPEARTRPNPQGLVPYFATPQEGADYLELLEAQKAAFAAQKTAPR